MSRLGRSTLQVLRSLEILHEAKVCVYIQNIGLYSLQPNIGTIREAFFLNQLSQSYQVTYPPKGDFLVEGKYLFEVGGRKKSFDQIKDIKNSYLAIDETEVGYGNKIPLWMFGLLY